jgi:hypothetical protein
VGELFISVALGLVVGVTVVLELYEGPRSSLTAQRSTSFPPDTRCQWTCSVVKLLPVGGMPKT